MHESEETNNHSIKALIVFRENGDADNLFVPILCDAIRMAGINVKYSIEDFWNSDTIYDIIHFQWPEEMFDWSSDTSNMICRLKERIHFFRSKGTHFVYTRHNVCPHHANEIISKAYGIIESQSDVIVHMEHFSRNEFIVKYPNSRNIIIPHHIYQYTYKENISMERARQYLNLSQKAFIITAFEEFHNRKERNMMLNAFHAWNKDYKLLLAPRLYPFSRSNRYGKNIFKRWTSRIGYYLLMPLFNCIRKLQAGASDERIDDYDFPYYIAASNVIFIQQKDVLNSIYVPLAFLFHKVAVGPNTGNTGELLKNTRNPTFQPGNKQDIVRALEEAQRLAVTEKGEMNYAYALENMHIDKVGKQYAELYKELANRPLSYC
ncbi:glycosyltransferase family 1 protein [uncultured Bacteroides sp.]|uniref:glycosyltransferase family 1 protein n=1 Tax=uncultured Bacteroides sp. TaxID=162156 RepID=UPI00267534DC|nr:glycosyltransferase family 1 protein [uncultured Bacteroides sp.]